MASEDVAQAAQVVQMEEENSAEGRYRKNYQRAKDNPNNQYYTPEIAMDYIYPHIKKYQRIWESCCGDGHIVRYLEKRGHRVIGTDIMQGEEFDFFTYAPPSQEYDIIVTNPPFTAKKRIFERLYHLGKPFAILMPSTALESNPIRAMLKLKGHYGIIMPPKTINYIPGDSENAREATKAPRSSRSFFHSSWFCYKIPGVKGVIIL